MSQLCVLIEQQWDLELPVVTRVADSVVRRRRGECQRRGIDDRDSESAGTVLPCLTGTQPGCAKTCRRCRAPFAGTQEAEAARVRSEDGMRPRGRRAG